MSGEGAHQPSFLDAIKVASRPALPPEEAAQVAELHDEFYVEYGKLVGRFIDRAPSALAADHLITQICDFSNPFSSCWEEHAKVYRPLAAEDFIKVPKKRGGR